MTACCEADCKTGHHWIIEMPHGASSIGQCKHCPAVRQFSNSAKEAPTFARQYKRMSEKQRQSEEERILDELRRLREIDLAGASA